MPVSGHSNRLRVGHIYRHPAEQRQGLDQPNNRERQIHDVAVARVMVPEVVPATAMRRARLTRKSHITTSALLPPW